VYAVNFFLYTLRPTNVHPTSRKPLEIKGTEIRKLLKHFIKPSKQQQHPTNVHLSCSPLLQDVISCCCFYFFISHSQPVITKSLDLVPITGNIQIQQGKGWETDFFLKQSAITELDSDRTICLRLVYMHAHMR